MLRILRPSEGGRSEERSPRQSSTPSGKPPRTWTPLSDQQPGKPVQGKVCRGYGHYRQAGQQEDQVELQQRGGLLTGDPEEKADAACRRGIFRRRPIVVFLKKHGDTSLLSRVFLSG